MRTQMLSLTLRPFTSILCTYTGQATLFSTDEKQGEGGGAYPEVYADGRARFVLWQPLLVREAQEQAALAHGGVPDEEQLHVHGALILRRVARHDGLCVLQVVTENTFRTAGKEREGKRGGRS